MNTGLVFAAVLCAVVRIPRLVERWYAPVLAGESQCFAVAAPPGFYASAGRRILGNYRAWLLAMAVADAPLLAYCVAGGHPTIFVADIGIAALLTRLSYYCARRWVEKAARAAVDRGSCTAQAAVTGTRQVLLAPRTLATYSNRRIEAAIAVSLIFFLADAAGRAFPLPDVRLLGWVIWLHLGLLLLKRALIRARISPPAEGYLRYVEWRESLRRLSATICDASRMLLIVPAFLPVLRHVSLIHTAQDASFATMVCTAGLVPFLMLYEWRARLGHLRVVQQTGHQQFLCAPDAAAGGMIVFEPGLPLLLLRRAEGYALNIAGTPVQTGLLYAASGILLYGLFR
jgi:hypothetical protein